MSNILNVSVTKLLNGERINSKNLESTDKKRMKPKNKVIVTLWVILVAVLVNLTHLIKHFMCDLIIFLIINLS